MKMSADMFSSFFVEGFFSSLRFADVPRSLFLASPYDFRIVLLFEVSVLRSPSKELLCPSLLPLE
jgi:hypothetical protein